MPSDVSYKELEERVAGILENDPNITIGLSDLSRGSYERLTGILKVNYDVQGMVNILNVRSEDRENYIIHVRRRDA